MWSRYGALLWSLQVKDVDLKVLFFGNCASTRTRKQARRGSVEELGFAC
jgi:hypothetical protein